MSTKDPIHMKLYRIAFWYSRNRRNGASRIQALRDAWAMTRPGYLKLGTMSVSGIINVGGLSIRSKDGEPIIAQQTARPWDSAQSDIAARVDVLRPKLGDTLVVTYASRLSAEQRNAIKAQVELLVPDGVKAMVLDGGASLALVAAPAAE